MKDEPFQFNDIEGIVKKAKGKSVIRNIVISTITLLFVGALFIFINGQIVNLAHVKPLKQISYYMKFRNPILKLEEGNLIMGFYREATLTININ